MHRVFLLSPANASGQRAALLTRTGATFELARRLQIGDAMLGEIYAFCSGLYFRGKLAYARRFAAPPPGREGVQVITPTRGLLPADAPMNLELMQEFAGVPVDAGDVRFSGPLIRTAAGLARSDCEVVLLGSVATAKYVTLLLPLFGSRLLFPPDFVGRGDMSRGALMLRCAAASHELSYAPVQGAILRGRRAAGVMSHVVARGRGPGKRKA